MAKGKSGSRSARANERGATTPMRTVGGAMAGAAAGSLLGPLGAAAGAVVGGVVGATTGKARKSKKRPPTTARGKAGVKKAAKSVAARNGRGGRGGRKKAAAKR